MATVVTMASSSSSTGADASTACAGSLDSIRRRKKCSVHDRHLSSSSVYVIHDEVSPSIDVIH